MLKIFWFGCNMKCYWKNWNWNWEIDSLSLSENFRTVRKVSWQQEGAWVINLPWEKNLRNWRKGKWNLKIVTWTGEKTELWEVDNWANLEQTDVVKTQKELLSDICVSFAIPMCVVEFYGKLCGSKNVKNLNVTCKLPMHLVLYIYLHCRMVYVHLNWMYAFQQLHKILDIFITIWKT